MTRDHIGTHKIALLATGDEISNGDILNTNAQEIARQLFDHGIHVGMHMVAADHLTEIEHAISFLLQTHDGLIITGGLGPTSDDITRYALAHVVNRALVFDETTWHRIVERFQKFGYSSTPESNRQQALFPEGATIIQNPHGTAAGCMLQHQKQPIFMLPGPPVECLPMFKTTVLPILKQLGFQHVEYHKNWLLFGVSEGQIAEELDALAKPYDCMTGYRLCYPYIEFKLHSNHKNEFDILVPLIEKVIAPYLIDNGKKTASEKLCEQLETSQKNMIIFDRATGGLLEATIKTPKTYSKLQFISQEKNATLIIQGLTDFWEEKNTAKTTLEIQFNETQQKMIFPIPFRGVRVKQYAVELICWKISEFLAKEFKI